MSECFECWWLPCHQQPEGAPPGPLGHPHNNSGAPKVKDQNKSKGWKHFQQVCIGRSTFLAFWASYMHGSDYFLFCLVLSSSPKSSVGYPSENKSSFIAGMRWSCFTWLFAFGRCCFFFFFFPCRMGLKKIPRFYLNVKQRCCRHSRHSLQLRAESQNALFAF